MVKDTRPERLELGKNVIEGFTFPDFDGQKVTPLGAGGSGIVFRASQTIAENVTIHRAIKFFLYRDDIARLSKHKKGGPVSSQDFKAEVYNITSFNHQNLVKVIDAGLYPCSEGEVPYIVTDYISGPTLKSVIHKEECRKVLSCLSNLEGTPENIIDLMLGIGYAVKHIHDHGFSHCDIAPKNVFIYDSMTGLQPVLGDLGISKPVDKRSSLRKTVFIAGSKDWMPEKVANYLEEEVDYDVFIGLQPYWDIYGFCATGLSTIEGFESFRSQPWFEALKESFERGLVEGGYESIDEIIERLEFIKPMHREVARIPELSNGIGKGIRKMMPVEALKASKRIEALIKHPAIFRLSKVPQLTTANYILPGAGHTRYEHTLGTIETMRKYVLSLLDEEEFLRYFGVDKIEKALVLAVLSSVTRFPLSNVVHEMRGRSKEYFPSLSRENILKNISEIKDSKERTIFDIVYERFPKVTKDDIFDVLSHSKEGESGSDKGDVLIQSMLQSSLDVRVLDFVRRDSHHLGIISGDIFDLDEILPHLTVYNHRLGLKATGVSVAEHIVSLRYWLFSRAYWNKPNRSFFAMCRYVFSRLHDASEDCITPSEITFINQDQMLLLMEEKCRRNDLFSALSVVERLRSSENRIYKVIYEGNRQAVGGAVFDWIQSENSSFDQFDQFAAQLTGLVAPLCDQWCDDREPPFIMDFPTEPGKTKLGEDIYVTSDRFPVEKLTDTSPIAEGVNKSFRDQMSKIRIYRNPDIRVSPNRRRDIEIVIEQALQGFTIK